MWTLWLTFYFFTMITAQDTCNDDNYFNFFEYECSACPNDTVNDSPSETPYNCECPAGEYFTNVSQIGFFYESCTACSTNEGVRSDN